MSMSNTYLHLERHPSLFENRISNTRIPKRLKKSVPRSWDLPNVLFFGEFFRVFSCSIEFPIIRSSIFGNSIVKRRESGYWGSFKSLHRYNEMKGQIENEVLRDKR